MRASPPIAPDPSRGRRPIARPVAWLLLMGLAGCSRGGPRQSVTFPPAPTDRDALAEDPRYSDDQLVTAHHYEIKQRLVVPQSDAFASLTDEQQAQLERLRAQSWLNTRVYLLEERALIIPPARHPAGALELLLCRDRGQLVVFSQDRWVYDLPLSALPDVLDRAPPSRRDVGEAQWIDAAPTKRSLIELPTARVLGQRVVRAAIALRFWPRRRGEKPWSLRTKVTFQLPLVAPEPVLIDTAFPLVMPLLQTRRGRLVTEALAQDAGTPLAWTRTVINETFGDAATPRFAYLLEDRGTVQLPAKRFSLLRDGFRRASRVSDPPEGGAQAVSPEELDLLRAGEPNGELQVQNDSSAAAVVYIDGVLVGWVAAGQSFTFKGPRQGYYRIYAVTPTGARAWGPRDIYLSGPLTLR